MPEVDTDVIDAKVLGSAEASKRMSDKDDEVADDDDGVRGDDSDSGSGSDSDSDSDGTATTFRMLSF